MRIVQGKKLAIPFASCEYNIAMCSNVNCICVFTSCVMFACGLPLLMLVHFKACFAPAFNVFLHARLFLHVKSTPLKDMFLLSLTRNGSVFVFIFLFFELHVVSAWILTHIFCFVSLFSSPCFPISTFFLLPFFFYLFWGYLDPLMSVSHNNHVLSLVLTHPLYFLTICVCVYILFCWGPDVYVCIPICVCLYMCVGCVCPRVPVSVRVCV